MRYKKLVTHVESHYFNADHKSEKDTWYLPEKVNKVVEWFGHVRICFAQFLICHPEHGLCKPSQVIKIHKPLKHTQTHTQNGCNNNNVHLSCAHQCPERSHDTY